ncbi:MAG: hypothetical protein HYR60_32770 [Acidobacteria bacterium]|nr:hypothetical protein [Acidobacteriota bacterium]
MLRCIECNSLLSKEEKVCAECGAQVETKHSGAAGYFSKLVTALFYLSMLGILAALFLEKGPPLTVSMLVTCALGFLKKSARDGVPEAVRKH